MNESILSADFDQTEEYEIDESYNRHYITIRPDGAIADAWSDGPHPNKSTENAICINEQGGYQLRLLVAFYRDVKGDVWHQRTEENPPIYTEDGIPLYKWDGSQVVPRTEEEIEADRAAIPAPPPSAQEQLRADVDFIAAMTGVSL